MTRTESLAALHVWATNASYPLYTPRARQEQEAAETHGLAAVRAIRDQAGTCGAVGKIRQTEFAEREARLAFRAALNAVGLQSL